MCDATNHKSYGLGLTSFNKVRKHKYFTHENITIFFYQWFYDNAEPGSLMLPPDFNAVYGTPPPPFFMLHVTNK